MSSPPRTTIQERVNAPGPGRSGVASVSATREYVAGGSWSPYLGGFYTTLPAYLDDVEAKAGDDIYTRMLADPQVFSAIHILKEAVLAQDMEILPAVPESDPDYEQAVEYAEFCRRCLDRLPSFRTRTLYQMLDALPYGHKLAEQVYEVAADGPDAGRLVPKAIKVKDRDYYGIVVDAYMNVIGVLSVIPGAVPTLTSGTILDNPARLPNFVPRGKFVLLSLLESDESPAGRSWLQSSYQAWYLKSQLWAEYLKYMLQFAGPSLVGTTAEGAQPVPRRDADGTILVDADNNPILDDPETLMLNALLAYRNSTALALPFGATVQTLFAYTDGAAFRGAMDLLDAQMNQAILFQTLATKEAKVQARAAAQVHQDILELPIQYIRTRVEEVVEQDCFARWLEYNFGPEAKRLTPHCELGDTETQDFANKANAIAALYKAGYLDASQLRPLDIELAIPPREAEEVQARVDAAQQKADAAAAGLQALAQAGQSAQTGPGVGASIQDQQQQVADESGAAP